MSDDNPIIPKNYISKSLKNIIDNNNELSKELSKELINQLIDNMIDNKIKSLFKLTFGFKEEYLKRLNPYEMGIREVTNKNIIFEHPNNNNNTDTIKYLNARPLNYLKPFSLVLGKYNLLIKIIFLRII